MKLKDGFILRKVGRQYVVAATGEASKNFNGDVKAFAYGSRRYLLKLNLCP